MSRFLQTLQGLQQDIPPMWFMRQAGRYLPEYRAVRSKAGSFLDLCYNPELACEVTLQPIDRFDVDAAILFADILVIPDALGQNLSFIAGEGPKLEPVVTPGDLDRFAKADIHATLSPIYETIAKIRAKLSSDKTLIGFAGAPWTVATYMLAGGPLKDPAALRAIYYRDPQFFTALIDLLSARTIDYLSAQIDAGAQALQLFDSWAGGLPLPVLKELSVNPIEKITKALAQKHPDVPMIAFPKGVGENSLEYARLPSPVAIGIDYSLNVDFARAQLSPLKVVQGGLDPLVVQAGGQMMLDEAAKYLRAFDAVPYIFNLGHGFVPETNPDHVADLVQFVRSGNWR